MFQKIQNNFQFLKERIRPHLSSRGQISIVLILIIAVALIMYSISLNWGRIAQHKTMTTIASNSVAANMASMIASYGEQQLQVQLGGRIEYCKRTNFLVLLVTFIIAVIIAYITVGTGTAHAVTMFLAVLGAVLAGAALIIHLTVVEPGLTRMWNKMMSEMPLDGQIIEGAIMSGVQQVVSDSSRISDHFDMDSDGLWVNDTDTGNVATHKDKISRFAYYYTRRLQNFAPSSITEIQNFIAGLSEFLYDNPSGSATPDNFGIFDPRCTAGTTTPTPYCNPCCQPQFEPDGVTPLRPEDCTPTDVAICVSGDYPAAVYPWQYEPSRERFANAFRSFREQLGIDDENQAYNRDATNPNTPPPQTLALAPNNVFRIEDATGFYTAAMQASLGIVGGTPDNRTGVFPFFWSMSTLVPAVTIPMPSPVSATIAKSDDVTMMTNFLTPPGMCSSVAGWDTATNRPKTDGFYWRPGSDEYCSTTYPYNNCIDRIGNCTDGTFTGALSDCGCEASDDPNIWHDDMQDILVWGLKEFSLWAQNFLQAELSDLNREFANWYPRAAFWIAPQCPVIAGCNNPTPADPVTCRYCNNEENDGMLIVWRDMMGSWVDLLDDWLYIDTFDDNTAFCLPTAATAATTMLYAERSFMPSQGTYTTTSADALTIANTGTVSLTVGTNLSYVIGQSVNIAFDATNYMQGTVTSYAPLTGALSVDLNFSVGSGSYAVWTVNIGLKDRNGVNMPPTWGDLNDTIACLNYNLTNVTKLTNCQTTCLANPVNYDANAAACLNLPRSVINIHGGNVAYLTAQRLQDCLSSTCSNSSGATLPVCLALPGVAVPPNCVGFAPGNLFYNAVRAERNNQFNLSNVCEPAGTPTTTFQDNIVLALDAANGQAPFLSSRHAELSYIRDQGFATRTTLLNGYVNFSNFLRPCSPGLALGAGCGNCAAGGPAAQLICARRGFDSNSNPNSLSNFVIYGWQGKPISGRGPTGTDPDKGYWHLVRVEAFAPQRCYGLCGTDRMPWVKTWTKGKIFNRKRCYGLVDTTGTVMTRVTRYDEDRDSPGARFTNNQFIWKFRFTNPGVPSVVTPGSVLTTDCQHPPAYDVGVSPSTKVELDAAFMINKPTDVNASCWNTVNALLDRGVKTSTCAQYFYDAETRHMSLKFIPCNPGTVDAAAGCAANPGFC